MPPHRKIPPATPDDDTVYFLSLSGGAWRGAVQYWVICHLMGLYSFASIHGVSVGSINGVMAAMGKLDELLLFWKGIDGLKGYLSLRWLYLICWFFGLTKLLELITRRPVMGGVYSMRGLHEKLRGDAHLEEIKTPFAAGVVSMNSGIYYSLDSRDMESDERLALACLASSCMAPFMTPPLIHLEDETAEPEAGFDGGGRNIFPIPKKEIAAAREAGKRVVVHAIGCMPLERIKRVPTKKVSGLIELALRGLEILEAEVYDTDILQLRQAVGPDGEVHLWLPGEHPGASFDATPEDIQRRLELSKDMVEQGPMILPGI